MMQQDQSCPSDSTSLGTSSKGPCSMATREREREGEIRIYSTSPHLKTPLTTCACTTHHAVLHIAYSTQHSFSKRSLKTGSDSDSVDLLVCHSHVQTCFHQSRGIDNRQLVSLIRRFSPLIWRHQRFSLISLCRRHQHTHHI